MQRQERWNSVLACNLLCATDDSFKDIDDLAEHKDEKTVFSFHSNFLYIVLLESKGRDAPLQLVQGATRVVNPFLSL